MINIANLLRNEKKGTILWSPLFGPVEFMQLGDDDKIWIKVNESEYFDKYGRYMGNEYPDAECLLFPSNDCRTWEGWKVPKPHYDIVNFKPFDKVLVRDNVRGKWRASIFSYHIKGRQTRYPFCCIGNSFSQCIPYEDNEHLLDTTDMCPEEYINW